MLEAIQAFLATIKERGHVLKLIENIDKLTIRIVLDQKNVDIKFHNGAVALMDNLGEKEITCKISGHEESLTMLIQGKERLRNLIRNGNLQVAATYRAVLLLESIFYLTKADLRINYN